MCTGARWFGARGATSSMDGTPQMEPPWLTERSSLWHMIRQVKEMVAQHSSFTMHWFEFVWYIYIIIYIYKYIHYTLYYKHGVVAFVDLCAKSLICETKRSEVKTIANSCYLGVETFQQFKPRWTCGWAGGWQNKQPCLLHNTDLCRFFPALGSEIGGMEGGPKSTVKTCRISCTFTDYQGKSATIVKIDLQCIWWLL